MLKIIRTDSINPDFLILVKDLNAELAIRDGEDYSFYAQFNKVDKIRHVVIIYKADEPVGCGAIKAFDQNAVEVKRMFVKYEVRGQGLGSKVLAALESWAKELNFNRCVLETGKKQQEAIGLYEKAGYRIIPNYGQYAGVKNSICFEKVLF
jgi:putative acetyltransferase